MTVVAEAGIVAGAEIVGHQYHTIVPFQALPDSGSTVDSWWPDFAVAAVAGIEIAIADHRVVD